MNRIKDDFKSKEYYQKELENLEKELIDIKIILTKRMHQDFILQ